MTDASAFGGCRYPCSRRCSFELDWPKSDGRNGLHWRDAMADSISTRHEQEHVLLKLTIAADRMLFIAHSAMHIFSACECMQRLLLAHLMHLQQHDALHLEEEQECTWVLTT